MSAKSQKRTLRKSFDQLVGASEERFRHCEAQGFGSFEIDHQLKARGLLNRYIPRFLTLQNLVNEYSAPPKHVGSTGAVRHQTAGFGKRARERRRWQEGVDPWGILGRARKKPSVIAVHGRCFTLGIELCLSLDVAVAASNTRFAQIEIKRGIFPFGGGTFRLPEQAGWGNAMRWLLTGDEFGADEAHRIGLVQEVVEPGKQLERAIQIAETIAAQSPLGVQATIASARQSLAEEASARELLPALQKLLGSDDAREGFMSFLERRAAKFTGK